MFACDKSLYVQYDVEIDEQLQQSRKIQQLDALELFHKVVLKYLFVKLNPPPCSDNSFSPPAYHYRQTYAQTARRRVRPAGSRMARR